MFVLRRRYERLKTQELQRRGEAIDIAERLLGATKVVEKAGFAIGHAVAKRRDCTYEIDEFGKSLEKLVDLIGELSDKVA